MSQNIFIEITVNVWFLGKKSVTHTQNTVCITKQALFCMSWFSDNKVIFLGNCVPFIRQWTVQR